MDPWLASWVGIDVVLVVLGLINLARNRHEMQTRLVVKWATLLVFLPVVGMIGYWFFRLETQSSVARRAAGTKQLHSCDLRVSGMTRAASAPRLHHACAFV